MDLILHYFPDLTTHQQKQFSELKGLYALWNEQINVISRKDLENFYERHVLHSLGIAKVYPFQPEERILDVGTGGGFPGIPLAILFPETRFVLVDSIGKKIKVVNEVAHALGLKNVEAHQVRAEQLNSRFDFVVSRAVTAMPVFIDWVKDKIVHGKGYNGLSKGILYLKGGDLSDELKGVKGTVQEFPLAHFYAQEFFETKKVVHWSP
ncbi:MAG: 16S rRNA (guanine(527)-N(7))-methyltransferase RsmG [Flavobacteriia bacterium]|nr:16S rRNA (guanine(527)-N(7))-methyltransferase RsmG [Flavobacteriia bacterium]